jgi:GH15 family glucan-1,4-alpha-glucosidase
MTRDSYVPIADYAFIGDCHAAALVARDGSIDWCCLPRFDAESVFGRLLDRRRGGYFALTPTGDFTAERRYVEGTLVLETTFSAPGGRARLVDFFSMRRGGRESPRREIVRLVEGLEGSVELEATVCPRFVYGTVLPWIRDHGGGLWTATGADQALAIYTDAELDVVDKHDLHGTVRVEAGATAGIRMHFLRPEDLDGLRRRGNAVNVRDRMDETLDWWRRWVAKNTSEDEAVVRSGIVLKALTYAPTGATAAAPTTSLPESLDGDRNWDYRFSWVRDSVFASEALLAVGHDAEADGFRRFVERSAAGDAEQLQVMYGVGGESDLREYVIEELEGYRGIGSVRVGNAAYRQLQLDTYGQLMGLAWQWHQQRHVPDADYWAFLTDVVEYVAHAWDKTDRGIWETRGEPMHFVHSKASCWNAIDTGIRLANETGRSAPIRRWTKVRKEIREAIETRGYDEGRGTFVRAFGTTDLDAALLLLPVIGFVPFDDERMMRTTTAVAEELCEDGLVLRYRAGDSLSGRQGTFLACTFWLARCLAEQRRVDEAKRVFERGMSTANDLGLFAEMYDPSTEQMLGNFPQALTHLSHITAALAIDRASG